MAVYPGETKGATNAIGRGPELLEGAVFGDGSLWRKQVEAYGEVPWFQPFLVQQRGFVGV